MTKQETIKQKWIDIIGEKVYEILKNHIDYSNGLCELDWFSVHTPYETFPKDLFDDIRTEPFGRVKARPKSLKGIEDNNSWVKIESESEIPREFDRNNFKLYYWTNNGLYESEDYKRWKLHYNHLEITHYKLEPIIKFQPPIY